MMLPKITEVMAFVTESWLLEEYKEWIHALFYYDGPTRDHAAMAFFCGLRAEIEWEQLHVGTESKQKYGDMWKGKDDNYVVKEVHHRGCRTRHDDWHYDYERQLGKHDAFKETHRQFAYPDYTHMLDGHLAYLPQNRTLHGHGVEILRITSEESDNDLLIEYPKYGPPNSPGSLISQVSNSSSASTSSTADQNINTNPGEQEAEHTTPAVSLNHAPPQPSLHISMSTTNVDTEREPLLPSTATTSRPSGRRSCFSCLHDRRSEAASKVERGSSQVEELREKSVRELWYERMRLFASDDNEV